MSSVRAVRRRRRRRLSLSSLLSSPCACAPEPRTCTSTPHTHTHTYIYILVESVVHCTRQRTRQTGVEKVDRRIRANIESPSSSEASIAHRRPSLCVVCNVRVNKLLVRAQHSKTVGNLLAGPVPHFFFASKQSACRRRRRRKSRAQDIDFSHSHTHTHWGQRDYHSYHTHQHTDTIVHHRLPSTGKIVCRLLALGSLIKVHHSWQTRTRLGRVCRERT